MTINISKHFTTWALLSVLLTGLSINANAQFSSGSTGADGALDYSNLPANTSILFDPAKFTQAPHPAGIYVFNFTTINIPAGITVVLSGQLIKGPVFWLAQGDVHIDGSIAMSGQVGHPNTIDTSLRIPSIPGPGGFSGGVGGDLNSPAQPGGGPGGGAAGGSNCCSAQPGNSGNFTGNSLFAPPIGGSGGGGAFCPSGNAFDPGGGAGGGALVIASSTSISVTGAIDARGGGGRGGCTSSGGGAGGAVKLVANTITGNSNGRILASGGNPGTVRLEGFQISIPFSIDVSPTEAAPGALFIPNQPVSIQVLSVAGTPLPTAPSGSFASPDVTINTGSPVTIAIQTAGIPPGTILTLNIYSEDGTTQTVQTTALQGTLQSATATATVTFPPDLSLGYVKATWTTP